MENIILNHRTIDNNNLNNINNYLSYIKNKVTDILSFNYDFLVDKYRYSLLLINKIPSLSISLLNSILTARNTDRVNGLISENNINEYLNIASPGDILLSRSDGYYSNLIIKGFWKHMSVYAGKGIDLRKEYTGNDIDFKDEDHYIIEVTTKDGVKLKNIKDYARKNDYLGVFSVNISEDENKKNVLNGLKHVGKKYDYSLNINTNEKMFCSQIPLDIHKEYLNPKLLNFAFVKTFLPNSFIEYASKNRDLVKEKFFIDNQGGENIVRDKDELLSTGNRTSYGIDYI